MATRFKTYIIDTNALLNDPDVIFGFSGAEVVIPSVVIKELDDLKRRRADARIRYNGRRAARLLYEVSKNGNLASGVTLENGALLRVDSTDDFPELPNDLDLGRVDDQILALAHGLDREPGVHVTMVSNDLTLLLRAETLGLAVYRFEGEVQRWRRRTTPVVWLRGHWPTLILAVLTVVFAASTAYLYTTRPEETLATDLAGIDDAVVLQALGVSPDLLEREYRDRVEEDPGDVQALVNLGSVLFDQARYLEAVDYYRSALEITPGDAAVRTEMGIALLRLGHRAQAITAFGQAATDAPTNPFAHYNLGLALAEDGQLERAIAELEESVRLTQSGAGGVSLGEAEVLIAELRQQLAQEQP
jgi:tetratricopeptide (TPR) repeat protein